MRLKLHATYDDGNAVECELDCAMTDNVLHLPPLDWPRIKELIVKPVAVPSYLDAHNSKGAIEAAKAWYRPMNPDQFIVGRELREQNAEDGRQ